ncbi:MAG: glycosyltransferase [Anaerolineaceae bacterium]|nr:glycosyltransferase [Anaerolineaceae bacterium]
MTDNSPTFSIVMPIYNEERYIREALDSILSQTDLDWEALLVDDGSTDATPGILDAYAKQDARFRVFHKANGGQSTAINKGVNEARGRWICWLSGDDYYHPQKLELNRELIQLFPDCEFFFTECQFVYSDRTNLEFSIPWLDPSDEELRLINLFRTNFVSGISVCVDKVAWLMHGGFDETLRYAHDLDMWMRLLLTLKSHYDSSITCYMRFHSQQESFMFPLGCQFDASKAIIRLINKHPFHELIPFADWSAEGKEYAILDKTLNLVAGIPDGNLLYGLGYHPALQMRLLEWIWNIASDLKVSNDLIMLIRDFSGVLARNEVKSQFSLLWKAIHAAVSLGAPRFKYFEVNPVDVGRVNYFIQASNRTEVTLPLQNYLSKYDSVQLSNSDRPLHKICNFALILPSDLSLDDNECPQINFFLNMCYELIQMGHNILVVGRSNYSFGYIRGLMYVGAVREEEISQLLSSFFGFDVVIALNWGNHSLWNLSIECENVNLSPDATSSSNLEILLKVAGLEGHGTPCVKCENWIKRVFLFLANKSKRKGL